MTRALARLLIASLMALAIPAQGLAAVSAGLCMAMGAHHEPRSVASADHDHAGDHQAENERHHAAGELAPQQENSSGNAHCPPCVSCCAAAVIAPAIQSTTPEQPASMAIAAMPYSVPGVLPDQLDRPPLSA